MAHKPYRPIQFRHMAHLIRTGRVVYPSDIVTALTEAAALHERATALAAELKTVTELLAAVAKAAAALEAELKATKKELADIYATGQPNL